MPLTLSYRGQIAEPDRIEDFEDRLVDLALELGGLAQIWRSTADDSLRTIRGVLVNLFPGQDPASLLLSPEGRLIGHADVQDSELGKLPPDSWVRVQTHYGPLEGHVALVEMLAALKRHFVPDLEVQDDSGYWDSRDLSALAKAHAAQAAAAATPPAGLSREASEDPEILRSRAERVAEQVRRVLDRPSEHAPVTLGDDDPEGILPEKEIDEATWDASYKHNRRRQERLQRALEEHLAKGEEHGEALENAMRDIGLPPPTDDLDEPADESGEEGDDLPVWLDDDDDDDLLDDEAWTEADLDDDDDDDSDGWDDDDQAGGAEGETDDVLERAARKRHPLLKRAMDLMLRLHNLFKDADDRCEQHIRTLFHGAGDVMGGLAQAMGDYGFAEIAAQGDEPPAYHGLDEIERGLRLVQLKRALRGAAFARGAMAPLRAAAVLPDNKPLDEAEAELKSIEHEVFQELARVRHRSS
ncbi:MAG: hypothetical protein HYS13_21280 [Planctomycetia bacterium]|nr:hypothetical protein [Planctomycetia bacterium]